MDKKLNAQMIPGVKVRLSGRFLRNTGQYSGGEGQSVWTVKECSCKSCQSGEFLSTDERKEPEDLKWFTPEELATMPELYFRHINRNNLVIVGKPSTRNVN